MMAALILPEIIICGVEVVIIFRLQHTGIASKLSQSYNINLCCLILYNRLVN